MIATARPPWRRVSHVLETSRSLKLPGRDRIEHTRHLSLEYAPRHCVEGDLRLITGSDPLQGVLLEACRQSPVVMMDEDHCRAERRRNHIHARPQRQLRHKAWARGPDCRQLKIVLGISQLGPQARHGRVHTVDLRLVHDTGLLGAGKGCLHSPFRRLVHPSLVFHVGNGERLRVPPPTCAFVAVVDSIERLLGAVVLRGGAVRRRQGVIVRELQLRDVLFGLCECGAALRYLKFVGAGIDTKQNISFLEDLVALDRHLDHSPLDVLV